MIVTTECYLSDNYREYHRVIEYHGKKIWVCCKHCCGIDGVLAVK